MNMHKTQLELRLDAPAKPVRSNRGGKRLPNARWWFSQMHAVVDQALDWTTKPVPSAEQIGLVLTKAQQ